MRFSALVFILFSIVMMSCNTNNNTEKETVTEEFSFFSEKFADVKILRYQVPGFEDLELNQKLLIYYLSRAAEEGRDILFDQNYKYNLTIRRTLEAIYKEYKGDRETEEFKALVVYLKRVWFSSGIHHHYSTDKFEVGFSEEYFRKIVASVPEYAFVLDEGQSKRDMVDKTAEILFNPELAAKRVNQSAGQDLIVTSANNYYGEGVTQAEAEAFYAAMADPNDKEPISFGLNSRLDKENGQLVEKVWKSGGTYSKAILKIVAHLSKAAKYAENDQQKEVIDNLINYYQTGDLKIFDKYNVAWLNDQESRIDFVNGFIETYGDPLGLKASWESVVNFKNLEATKRTEIISSNAQWFEDHSPVDPRFKKKEVKGVTAKVITAAMLGGDCYPASPLGINLPNSDWIRKEHGSKSVSIENVAHAYDQVSKGSGFLEEFMLDEAKMERMRKYGFQSGNLHTDLHECLGHGSGQLLATTKGDELKAYGSPLEEARADLFALYYMGDEKMVELGLLPDMEAYKSAYDDYIRNGMMTQLTRIKLGDKVEQAHMRNRQTIAQWAYENGKADKVIEKKVVEGKTYFVINDYKKLQALFGKLLAEVQRIKSEGDFEAGRDLIENYGVNIDPELHKEVLDRYAKLDLAPYSGFINPSYELVGSGSKITDVKVTYNEGYTDQMLRYSEKNSWLPNKN